MDFSQIPVLSMLKQRMQWLSERQGVLSENVANANTPGYQARDLAPIEFDALVGSAQTGGGEVQRAGFLPLNEQASDTRFSIIERPDVTTSPDGNSVSLEEQMMRVSETQVEYSAATTLYQKALGLIRMAVSGGKS
ncbi:MAG: flagellar basal body rod protein FlgB [Alphaproteobacteria bacterium]|nr:flagellar basal body rod protein FlgB [Alphaproteobacteria bacterium]